MQSSRLNGNGRSVDLGPIHKLPRRDSYENEEEYMHSLLSVLSAFPSSSLLLSSMAKSKDWIRFLDMLEVMCNHDILRCIDMDTTLIVHLLVLVSNIKETSLSSARCEFVRRLKELRVPPRVVKLVLLQFLVFEMKHSEGKGLKDIDLSAEIDSLSDYYTATIDANVVTHTRSEKTCFDCMDMFEKSHMFEHTLKVCRELLPYKQSCSKSMVAVLSIISAILKDTAGVVSIASLAASINNSSSHEDIETLLRVHSEEWFELKSCLNLLLQVSQNLDDKKAKEVIITSTSVGSADRESQLLLLGLLQGQTIKSMDIAQTIDSLKDVDDGCSNLLSFLLNSVGCAGSHCKICTVGDGDFSFSKSLLQEWYSKERSYKMSLVASTLLPRNNVMKMYKAAKSNIDFIEMESKDKDSRVKYEVDVMSMTSSAAEGSDYIIFNFPYADTNIDTKSNVMKIRNRSDENFDTYYVAVARHQSLIRGLFNTFAKELTTTTNTKLLVTVLLSQSREWGIETIAFDCGLNLVQILAFSFEKHRQYDYTQMRTRVDAKFTQRAESCMSAWTFVFEKNKQEKESGCL